MLKIQEIFVNLDKGYRFGESDWYEPYTDDLGQLYRSLRCEYGRCIGKVYVDLREGGAQPVGWVFRKRMEYEDAHRISDPEKRTYLRETWVSYRHE